MSKRSLQGRALVIAGMLIAGLVLLHGLSHGERVSTRLPLREIPLVLGAWRGQERPLEKRIVEATNTDDYLNRVYFNPDGKSIGLYLGFYETQRTGDTIHSPKHCLPGTGWEPLRTGRLQIEMQGGPAIEMNEYLVQKGLDRQLVLYWYQGRGRVEASEYRAKVWMVVDAISRNRTDGTLVRLVTPTSDGEEKARARAIEFAQTLYPRLGMFIPD